MNLNKFINSINSSVWKKTGDLISGPADDLIWCCINNTVNNQIWCFTTLPVANSIFKADGSFIYNKLKSYEFK